jgi:hypothetical protein
MPAPPGQTRAAGAPSYAPEGEGQATEARPQTVSEALNAAYRLCDINAVPAPGHRRMVTLVKRYLATRRRIDDHFASWVIAYADPTGETAVRNVLQARR